MITQRLTIPGIRALVELDRDAIACAHLHLAGLDDPWPPVAELLDHLRASIRLYGTAAHAQRLLHLEAVTAHTYLAAYQQLTSPQHQEVQAA